METATPFTEMARTTGMARDCESLFISVWPSVDITRTHRNGGVDKPKYAVVLDHSGTFQNVKVINVPGKYNDPLA
jgi:hypothetical protein